MSLHVICPDKQNRIRFVQYCRREKITILLSGSTNAGTIYEVSPLVRLPLKQAGFLFTEKPRPTHKVAYDEIPTGVVPRKRQDHNRNVPPVSPPGGAGT